MLVREISNIEEFEKLKENWDAIYSADPNTTFFVSWQWMLGWIRGWTGFTTEEVSYDWGVIGIKPDANSPYVAFMPLCSKSIKEPGFKFMSNLSIRYIYNIRTLYLGGYPWSDNTGFICLPGYIEKAIPIFSTYIQEHVKWDIFELRNVADPRIDFFLKYFSRERFKIREIKGYTCPYIILPDSWDKYLEEFLGKSTRRCLKYDTRKIQSLNEFSVTHAQSENLGIQIETLLSLYQTRWGHKSEAELNRFRILFKTCFENNSLWLDILWEGPIPIAGLAVFLDHKLKRFAAYTVASNEKYAPLSPGKVMLAYGIRYAIENRYQIFDFGTGGDKYKFSFGPKVRISRNILINKDFNIKIKSLINKVNERIPIQLKNLVKQ